MATYEKRGKTWRVIVQRVINGKKVRLSATFPIKAQAQSWATEKESELLGIKRIGLTRYVANDLPDKTLFDAMSRYAKEVSVTRKGERWEKVRIEKIMRDFPLLTAKSMKQIAPDDLARFRDERLKTVSEGSVLRELTLLSSVFETAH